MMNTTRFVLHSGSHCLLKLREHSGYISTCVCHPQCLCMCIYLCIDKWDLMWVFSGWCLSLVPPATRNLLLIQAVFVCRQWRTMPYYRNSQAHIWLFSAICVSTSVLSASLPSASLQTLPSLSCQPRRRAELNQTNLQKGKRHHHHSSSPLPPLLLRRGWHLVNGKLCHIWWGAERKQWNTRESSPLGVQSILQGLRCSVAGWLLSLSSSMANGGLSTSDNTPLCNRDGLESPTITTVAKWFENCGILWNSSGPFSSIPFSLSQLLSVLSHSDYSWCLKCTKWFLKMAAFYKTYASVAKSLSEGDTCCLLRMVKSTSIIFFGVIDI